MIKQTLIRFSEDAEADGGVSPNSLPDATITTTMYKLLENEKFVAAIAYFKANKNELMKENDDLCYSSNDVDIILNLYCKKIIQEKPGIIFMVYAFFNKLKL